MRWTFSGGGGLPLNPFAESKLLEIHVCQKQKYFSKLLGSVHPSGFNIEILGSASPDQNPGSAIHL